MVAPVEKLVLNIEPHQSGSGDPSPSNIRPITGYDSVSVVRAGKNLIPSGVKTKTINGVTFTVASDGTITCSGTASNRAVFYIAQNIPLKAGTYKLNGSPVAALPVGCYLNFGGVTGISASEHATRRDAEFTLAEDANTGYVRIDIASGTNTSGLIFKPMIRLASEADPTFEPYQGETYDITFPSEAGTVYGGSLDVTTGVLTVNRAQIASYAGETLPSTWISDRDVYSAGATPTTGAQVVYELATTFTYQLTPTEVTTLLGDNTIWMDADGELEMTYTGYIN